MSVSPRPWKPNGTYLNSIDDKYGNRIVDHVIVSDAAHIVKCVNEAEAKDKRIAELEGLAADLISAVEYSRGQCDLTDVAHAILTKKA